MEQMIAVLAPFLGRRDKIGYAAARNTRILRDAAMEYLQRRDELIRKHGSPQVDEDGNPTGRFELRLDTPEYKEYLEEIAEWALIEHEPRLYKIPYDVAEGELTGDELLSIDWMFEDTETC